MSRTRIAGGVATAIALSVIGSAAYVPPAVAKGAPPASDTTSRTEARRVDSVPTPDLAWSECARYPDFPATRCATVSLPRDYDEPDGPEIKLALAKTPALDQEHKIGTLFVNPGGPGGSAADLAVAASQSNGLSKSVLEKFDIVGFDPRGTNASEQLRCFADAGSQQPVLDTLNTGFPYTQSEIRDFSAASERLGVGCSDHGAGVAGAMSTAEVARDMDVLRRAVGDKKLTYLGFSYGTYLGQVYANLFPDRVRSLVIDGVVDPVAWVGSERTKKEPQFLRLRSAEATNRALTELLRRCDQAGRTACAFASDDSVRKFDTLVNRIQRAPITIDDPDSGAVSVNYQAMNLTVLADLYDQTTFPALMSYLQELWTNSQRSGTQQPVPDAEHALKAADYDNYLEAATAVLCSDGLHGDHVTDWVTATERLRPDQQRFGDYWAWASGPCSHSTWTVGDEDSYSGPFTARTSGPTLVIGNFWDPATNYQSAETVAGLLPNSRLLLSDSWGHAAYGTSSCVNDAVSAAVLRVELPTKGAHCAGDQPFGVGGRAAQPRANETDIDQDAFNELVRGRTRHD